MEAPLLSRSAHGRGDAQVSFEEKMIFELSSGTSLSGTKEVTVETKMCICFHLLTILVDCDSKCADRKFMLSECLLSDDDGQCT